MNQITVRLYPNYIRDCDTSILDAVLLGLIPKSGALKEEFLSCLAVEVFDDSGNEVDSRPPVLIPGFVDFAKKLFSQHPHFVYVASIFDDFFRQAIIAVSGDVTAVQAGDNGTIFANGNAYFQRAQEEVEKFILIASERGAADDCVHLCHLEDLKAYLLLL